MLFGGNAQGIGAPAWRLWRTEDARNLIAARKKGFERRFAELVLSYNRYALKSPR